MLLCLPQIFQLPHERCRGRCPALPSPGCEHCTAPLSHPFTCGHPTRAPTRSRRAGSRGRTRAEPNFCTILGTCVCPALPHRACTDGASPRAQSRATRDRAGRWAHQDTELMQRGSARLGTARLGPARFISLGSCRRVPGAAVPPCGPAGKLRRPPRRSPLSPAAVPAPRRGPAGSAPGCGSLSALLVLLFFFPRFLISFFGRHGANCPAN